MNEFERAIKEAKANGKRDLARRIKDEMLIATALLDEAFRSGYEVIINNGDSSEKFISNKTKALDFLSQTDEDIIEIWYNGTQQAWFYLVYGNYGFDVVSDFSNNPVGNGIWETVLKPLSEKIERGDLD